MKIIYRIVIVFGFAAPGLLLGAFLAAKSGVADGSGLAGGAIVLGYGLIGAAIAAVLGLVAGLQLSESALRRGAGAAGVGLLIFAAYTTMQMRSMRLADLDPPEAYEGIPTFELMLERTDLADPVLAKKLSVNSKDRTWTTQLPDRRNCSAQAPAASLRKAATALTAFLESTGGEVACKGEPEIVITWRIETDAGQNKGAIPLNEACLASNSHAQFLSFALQRVSLTSKSRIKCR